MLTQEKIEEIKMQLIGLEPEKQQQKLKEILSTLSEEEREQLVGKQQCPFCLMVEGKIQVKTVYEDEKVLAILDINPANKGHTLVFPKSHAKLFQELNESLAQHCSTVAHKISNALIEGLKAEGTSIFVANGTVAGQTAPHVLINVIPRFSGDNIDFSWNHKKIDETEMDKTLEAIKFRIRKETPKIENNKERKNIKEDQRIP